MLEFIIPVITFILGFLVSRFTMTKKERKDHLARLQENSNKLTADLDEKFQGFTTALNKYVQKKDKPNLDDFFDIATKGDSYFSQCKIICDSILSGNVDKTAIKNTHIPVIKDVVEKTLPTFYNTLQEIAQKKNIEYQGTLKKENYKSIYGVYDKYVSQS